MKNLQRLLLAATFMSIIPSTGIFCEDMPTLEQPSGQEEADSPKPVTPLFAKAHPMDEPNNPLQSIKSALNNAAHTIKKEALILSLIGIDAGVVSFIAGAQGSHSLKKAKNNLRFSKEITDADILAKALAPLNKGITSNRRLMAFSFVIGTLSATSTINEMSKIRFPL